MVPETLLKKRKSQEKEREQRAADLKKKREVSEDTFVEFTGDGDYSNHQVD